MAIKLFTPVLLATLSLFISAVEPFPFWHHASTPQVISPKDGLCATAVTKHGYKCEEFEARTADGYILSMQRIPEGRVGGGPARNKPPVLLQHGVLVWGHPQTRNVAAGEGMVCLRMDPIVSYNTKGHGIKKNWSEMRETVDGMTWLLNSPEQSLAFILADNGFDVWIANGRGTRFSRKHASLDPAGKEYWNWSWDELAAYDLPATLDFVHQKTGQQINYVGHSMGTLVALASLSQGKMANLKSVALLSPVAYLSHMTTGIGMLAAQAFVGEITSWFGISEFNPKERTVINFLNNLCANPGIDCYDLMSSFTGKNCCLNSSTVDVFLQNEPQSTSVKNMVHLAQTVRDGVLSKYNYGRTDINMAHYGQGKPPVYNLSNIPGNLPIFVSYGGQDALADVRDVLLLLDSLKLHDGDKLTVQFVKDYAHADFIMGITAKEIVYNAMIAFFKRQ